MMNHNKYIRQYFMPPVRSMKWAEKEYVDHAPVWCSVDLRDGNQALVVPMSLEQKVQFFQLLVKIGFKEIEVGFPAASDTEYQFLRTLIEQDLIPDDVTIQVLTQAREHIIRKTFEALEGAKHAIVHVYNSTSLAQREQVFHKSKEEILQIAVEGAKLLKELAEEAHANYRFEYSPESFTGTEIDYAAEVCNAVLDVWQPTADNKAIINLPSTVQMSMPHVYASQIEYMNDHLKYRENVVLSLHPHNDRGCGISDAEMGILAGADRIEGTLFGNGERTGNVDIITLALNMYAQGVDPELDFSDMPYITEHYEEYTGMKVDERSPYAGGRKERNMNNITLIGMPGAGKSTVGIVLAKVLGYDFVDTDLLIQKEENRLLWQIMRDEGIDGFNRIEERVNSHVCADHSVISPGGSVVYSARSMEHLRDISTVIYLKVDCNTLSRRLGDLRKRGVVLKPGQTLATLYEERTPLYEAYAHLTVDVSDTDVPGAVERIQKLLLLH